MEENNPLFDLSKIRIELLFLNEKDIPNINLYENNLLFYLNKYLYKIDMKTQNENNIEKKNSNFIFLEFYTKNLNMKSLNIHDTNLLSNKTDFFCNILFILDTNDKEKIKNILKNISTPKELTYTLIFYDKNSEFNLSNDDIFNIDKNSYDVFEMCLNNNKFNKCNDIFKNCHQYLENALKKMIIKYRIYNLNQKIDISINNKNEEENNEDEKIKNKLDILEIHIKLGNYQKSLEYLNSLKESFVVPKELIIFQEYEIIINFLIEYNNNKLEYDKKIEEGFLDVIENYKNLRQINLMVNAYLKLLYYLSYFDKNEIKARMNEIINNLLCEKLLDEKINKNNLFLIYLNISHIYNKIKFKKKFFIFLFLAYKEYYKNNNNKKIKPQNNLNYFNFLIKNIEKYFFSKNYSSISNYYEYNFNQFLDLSNIIKLSQYKPIKFTYKEKKENSKEKKEDINMTKKHLYINNIYFGYYHIFHMKKWELIQNKIYKNLIKYYKSIKDYDKTIIYCLDLLQICHNILPKEKQNEIINIIKKKSSKIKYINYFNVDKIPIIIKFTPKISKIKFDFQEKPEKNEENDLFIFNPWNQKKENNINYYWTLNSTQSIYIKFYNPLNIPIFINNIQLLYIAKDKNKKNINCFNYSPSLVNIPPLQDIEYKFKFKSLIEGIYNIIGIEYFFEGIKIRQYIKNDGNGIFYRYNNLIPNLFNSKLKDKINLDNIRIYPEITQIKLIPLNPELINNEPLSLFDFQKYIFYFDIINHSEKYIKQINLAIYAYKKEDYKITLHETEIKSEEGKYYLEPKNTKKIEYEFIQKKRYLKIEFIIYYIFDNKEDEINKNNIKPYLYFKKELNNKKLFSFSNPLIVPIHNNTNLEKILSLEKTYSKYNTQIISNNYYFSFSLELLYFYNNKIFYEIINKDNTIEKGDFIQQKKFKIFLDKKEKLSKAFIKWKINKDINGIINCFDLVRNIFKLEIEQNFDFDIKKINKGEYIEIIYEIKNNTKFSFYNMKLKILIYQENNKNINLNFHLENDIFIHGKLIHFIDEIKPKENINISIKLYPNKIISFNTTFLFIDQKLKLLYVPSFSIKI